MLASILKYCSFGSIKIDMSLLERNLGCKLKKKPSERSPELLEQIISSNPESSVKL